MAQALARLVNVDTASGALTFAAAAEGTQLVLVDRAGAAFTPTLQVTRATGANIDTATATSAVVTLGGGLAAGKSTALVLIGPAARPRCPIPTAAPPR